MKKCNLCHGWHSISRPCSLVRYFVTIRNSYKPNERDFSEKYILYSTIEEIAETLVQEFYEEDPGELYDHYVFLKNDNGDVVKFEVNLDVDIRYYARNIGQ